MSKYVKKSTLFLTDDHQINVEKLVGAWRR